MQVGARSTKKAVDQDLERLQSRAFNRAASARQVLHRYHAAIEVLNVEDKAPLQVLYAWMFAPPTLWPFDIQKVLAAYLNSSEKGKRLVARQRLLIDLLPPPPGEAICAVVAEHELRVQKGVYENLVKTDAKYAGNDLATRTDPELYKQWMRIRTTFNVGGYRDHKGVIRRTMSTERNLRASSTADALCSHEMFQAVFDAFCLRWNLYGMQNDTPLLLKFTVNATAYGTMIFIPAYWSFDPKRDIRWDAIADLHRVRVPKRQGPAFTEGYSARLVAARKLVKLDQEALRRALKGQEKHDFLCVGLGWTPGTSPRRISRLRADFKTRMAAISVSK